MEDRFKKYINNNFIGAHRDNPEQFIPSLDISALYLFFSLGKFS